MANDDDVIIRFLSSKGDFSVTKGLVKRTAFTPYPRPSGNNRASTDGRLETSVTWCSSNAVDVVARWEEYGKPRDRLFGWAAGVTEHSVALVGLLIQDDEPPRKHAVMVGWPLVDGLLDKSKSMDIALRLANGCYLHQVPPPCPRE